MKTLQTPSLVVLLLVSASCFFSCRKLQDEIHHAPALQKAKITSIVFASDSDAYAPAGQYNKTTYFNASGEPLKTIAALPQTGNSHQLFLYDKKGRLSKRVLYFGDEPAPNTLPSVYDIFVEYTYAHDQNGNIAADTFRIVDGSALGTFISSITTYTYDCYGRMTQSREHNLLGSADVVTQYAYDIDGNLKGYLHDNMPNPKMCSKVLSFLCRDYSLNNRIKANPYVEGGPVFSYEYGKYNLASKAKGIKIVPDENTQFKGVSTFSYSY